jgi:hypothetical protein
MVIGLLGFIGSGKSTVGDTLCREFSFQKLSFADPLKDAVAQIFSWPRYLLEGDTVESREFRETVDPWWSEKFSYNVTPRYMIQLMGTEAGRNVFHTDLWVHSLARKILPNRNYVVPDVRFPNEIDFIRKSGGFTVRVCRGPEPEWFELAKADNEGLVGEANVPGMHIRYPKIHFSEWAWIGTKLDYVLKNDDTLEVLDASIKYMLKKFYNPNGIEKRTHDEAR